jgi:hypothetical protein
MNEPEGGPEAGWSFLKVLGFVVGLLGMVGFGFCSLCGLFIGATTSGMMSTVLLFAVPGLVVAGLGFLLMRTMFRRSRKPPTFLP